MSLSLEEEARRRVCYVAFWRSLQFACESAGGYYSWAKMKDMRLEDVATLLCTNGIRFTYLPECSYGGDPHPHEFVKSSSQRWNGSVKTGDYQLTKVL